MLPYCWHPWQVGISLCQQTPSLLYQQGIKPQEPPSPSAKPGLPNLYGCCCQEQSFLPKITRWQSAFVFKTARGGGSQGWETQDDPTKRLGSVYWCRCWSRCQPAAASKEVSVVAGCPVLWPSWWRVSPTYSCGCC